MNRIDVKISDPWELGEAVRWQPLAAKIVSIQGESVLLRLDCPFEFKATTCEFFVASPRLEGYSISELDEGKPVFCGLTRISREQAASSNPHDLSRWRGGLTLIGNLDPT